VKLFQVPFYNIDIFDAIHSSYNLFGKSGTINAFLKTHQLKKEEIIYIGDELRDIQACQSGSFGGLGGNSTSSWE
jgi:phosphoglycolate phosphatase-like HAD superfamily hydrolase